MAGLDHSTKCLQKLSLKSNSVHKSLNALHAYEQTSSVQEKAASECIHLGKQYEEAHDSIKEEKPFVAKCWSA